MKKIIITISIILISCSQQRLAKRDLIKKNYKEIEFFKYKECICSNGDIYYTGFMAVKDSVSVRGVIWRKHKYKRIFGISFD